MDGRRPNLVRIPTRQSSERQTELEAPMYIAIHSLRPAGAVRHETLRKWVEVLLASEQLGAAADDIRYAVAKKIQPARPSAE